VVLKIFLGFSMQSCDQLTYLLEKGDVAAGLRKALSMGTDTTVSQAGVTNGFLLKPQC
jgi:hypothetical protein